MAHRTFVSFKFKDNAVVRNIKSFFQPNGGPIQGEPVFVVDDASAKGPDAVKAEILRVMGGCDAVLFIIGNDSHNSMWINHEAIFAKSKAWALVATRMTGFSGGLPHELTSVGRVIEVPWQPDRLAAELNKVGKTGS